MGNEWTRRHLLKSLSAGLIASQLQRTAQGAAAPQRPSFLFVLADDLTSRALGYNNAVIKTPHLNVLAREGIIFDRAYIASPICVASRASLQTGLFPQQHGAIALDADGFQQNVVEQHRYTTFAQELSRAGYLTAFCGKSHLGEPRAYGYEVGVEHKDVTDDESFAFATQFLTEQRDSDRPFLLWLGARQPHVPLLPAEEWLALYKTEDLHVNPNFREAPPAESIYNQGVPGEHYYRDTEYRKNYKDLSSGPPRTQEQIIDFMHAYYAIISRLDHQIGQLIDTLKASGRYDNTVIVFMGDNGYHLGNHGLGNKITMHEESTRVPLLMHWTGLPAKGVRAQALVSSLDIYPTLLDLAGVPLPAHLMGLPLTPVFKKPDEPIRPYVASECVGVGGKQGMGHRMVRTTRWKYVLTGDNEETLFDEKADAYEMKNVIGDAANRETLAELRGYMREWMQRVGDTHAPPPSA